MVAEGFAGGFAPGVREGFTRQLAAAAIVALDDLAPASFGQGGFEAPDFVRNRLLGDGYEPRTMSFFGPQLPECFITVLGELTAALADR